MAQEKQKLIGKAKALSKVNLYLRITGKRNDGYHEIESLFLPLNDPCDTIHIYQNDSGLKITSDTDSIPVDKSNICHKAALEFANLANSEPNWHIHIEKKIPVSAGLGGGSSNAAAVLKILNEQYKVNDKKLNDLATSIGADVPFFLNSVPAVAKGIGEELAPVKLENPLYIVLVNPKFPVSAKWAYSHYIKDEINLSLDELLLNLNSDTPQPFKILNDLAPAVCKKFPILQIILEKLNQNDEVFAAGMSGSGPTLFAVCPSADAALKLSNSIKLDYEETVCCFASAAFLH